MPDDPPLISLHRIHKRFANGVLALQAIDLRVRAGEFVSLLGPSGCGKSTVLRLVAGLERPSEGTIDAPALREGGAADTAFVFQDPTLMPWASVADNVWLPLRLAGRSRGEAAAPVREALARVGLADFAHSFPAQLSGGMRMRTSIARALVTAPRALLMDEPFAALDEITRHRLNDDLLRLWLAQRFAALFVTHSVFESVYLSERVLVMGARPGRIIAEVAIDEPYPRKPAFRESPRFLQACRELGEALGAGG